MGIIKKNEKRDIILKSAIRILSEKGLEKTTVSDIVKDAGVAQGTFYLYFKSKSSLIPAIAEQMLQNLLNEIKKNENVDISFFEQIEEIIDITFLVTEKYKDVLALCYSGLAITGALNEWEKVYTPYYQWLEGKIVEAQNNKEVRTTINSSVMSKLLVEIIEGTAERVYLFEDNENNLELYKKEIIQIIIKSFQN